MLITHRCTKCNHPDFWRSGGPNSGHGPCSCGCNCAPAAPEVIPTWDEAGQRIERIAKPGTKLAGAPNAQGGAAITTCGCADCKALHKKLTK